MSNECRSHGEKNKECWGQSGQPAQLLGQLHAATAAHVQQSSQHKRMSELISGCWKENENSREAGLHVRPNGVIPIQPCGFPVCRTACERTARWQSRQRMASWGYRCTLYVSPALSIHVKILLKIIYAPRPSDCSWFAMWFIPSTKKFLLAPLTPALCWRVCLLALVVVAGSRSRLSLPLFSP